LLLRRTRIAEKGHGGPSFCFTLPIHGTPPELSLPPSLERGVGGRVMTEPAPRILVIEDEAQMRRFLRVSLSNAGYQLLEAETASSHRCRTQRASQRP
jgi:hypothetical protein